MKKLMALAIAVMLAMAASAYAKPPGEDLEPPEIEFKQPQDGEEDYPPSKKMHIQLKDMPPDIKQRKEWLNERAVLKHSFIMRNRYGIRSALVVIGLLMILTGLALRVFVSC